MLMKSERKENLKTKEYIEKAYRLLYEGMKKDWEYLAPEEKEKEMDMQELKKKSKLP